MQCLKLLQEHFSHAGQRMRTDQTLTPVFTYSIAKLWKNRSYLESNIHHTKTSKGSTYRSTSWEAMTWNKPDYQTTSVKAWKPTVPRELWHSGRKSHIFSNVWGEWRVSSSIQQSLAIKNSYRRNACRLWKKYQLWNHTVWWQYHKIFFIFIFFNKKNLLKEGMCDSTEAGSSTLF